MRALRSTIMKAKKTKRDARRVDLTNFNELRNLAFSFKVSVDEIKAAVDQVGDLVDDIQRHLKAYHNPYVHRTKGWHW